jgi:uncharacterized membrane protein
MESEMSTAADEDRILRVWTPFILRTVLIAAGVVVILGLGLMLETPGQYVKHFRLVQENARRPDYKSFARLFARAFNGEPRSITTIGLMILTLVPLARVAFCWVFFIKRRNWAFVFFTAYVLAGLVVGVILGRMG